MVCIACFHCCVVVGELCIALRFVYFSAAPLFFCCFVQKKKGQKENEAGQTWSPWLLVAAAQLTFTSLGSVLSTKCSSTMSSWREPFMGPAPTCAATSSQWAPQNNSCRGRVAM